MGPIRITNVIAVDADKNGLRAPHGLEKLACRLMPARACYADLINMINPDIHEALAHESAADVGRNMRAHSHVLDQANRRALWRLIGADHAKLRVFELARLHQLAILLHRRVDPAQVRHRRRITHTVQHLRHALADVLKGSQRLHTPVARRQSVAQSCIHKSLLEEPVNIRRSQECKRCIGARSP